MSERRPPPSDTPPKETPSIDPPRKEAPVREPSDSQAPPPEDESPKPKPHERVQKLRLAVRAVWWSAVVLTLCFGGLALWMGVGQRDPFALVFVVLAGCCAVAGYGTLVAFRHRPAS